MRFSTPDDFFSTLFRSQQQSNVTDTVLPAMAVFGAGMMVGVGVGLMLAPKSGTELRDDMARTANRLGD